MRVDEYAQLEAGGIAQLVATGEVSAGEVLNAALAAIERANPQLNAVVELYAQSAAAQIAGGLPHGPLQGVPVLLKDLGCPALGTRTTFGSRLFAEVPAWLHDCAFAECLRKAGAVVLGRTNSCEFGISLITEPSLYGATHNPHRLELTAGGSSGGSAAAVVAGMVPLAHGTDGCGSIRVPASHCGLFGLKPSRGRISFAPDVGESWGGMSVNGALTRSVRDAALMLDVVSVPYPGDPYYISPPVRPFCELLAQRPRPLRVGMPVLTRDQGIDPECLAAMQLAADVCQSLGHRVVTTRFESDVTEAFGHFMVIWGAQLAVQLRARYQQLGRVPVGPDVEPLSRELACRALKFSATDYLMAVRYLHGFGRRFAQTFAHCDVVLTPVTARPAWPLGELSTEGRDVEGYLEHLFRLCPFTVQFNMAGCPAMSVPVHWTAAGVPVGAQFGARMGEEGVLLQLAAQLEEVTSWGDRIRRSVRRWQGA